MPGKRVRHVPQNDANWTHAQGKPVRGVRPGVRGPAVSKAEETQRKIERQTQLIVQSARPPTEAELKARERVLIPGAKPPNPQSQRNKVGRILQDMIREIGEEQVSEATGWSRIEAVVRRLYSDALGGKTSAQALLFERGWGRVPLPVQMDMRSELLEVMRATGLTPAEVQGDPVLREIMGDAIEGTYRDTTEDPTTPARAPGDPGTNGAGSKP